MKSQKFICTMAPDPYRPSFTVGGTYYSDANGDIVDNIGRAHNNVDIMNASEKLPSFIAVKPGGSDVPKIKSGDNDGSANAFYAIPEWVEDADTLSEYLELDPYEFNVLKTLFLHRGKRHSATNEKRELNKRLHYTNRSIDKYYRNHPGGE